MDIQGISHITFIVRDLERMTTFLCTGLGAREIYDSHSRTFSLSREKFFLLGGVWLAAWERGRYHGVGTTGTLGGSV